MQQANRYIEFKDDGPGGEEERRRLKEQWKSGLLKASLVVVVLFAALYHFLMTGKPAVITSLYRKKTTDSGVHEDGRGADLRSRHLTAEQAQEWEDAINRAFPWYGKYSSSTTAKTALIHEIRGEDGKSEGVHLHLQTPPSEPQPRENSIV